MDAQGREGVVRIRAYVPVGTVIDRGDHVKCLNEAGVDEELTVLFVKPEIGGNGLTNHIKVLIGEVRR